MFFTLLFVCLAVYLAYINRKKVAYVVEFDHYFWPALLAIVISFIPALIFGAILPTQAVANKPIYLHNLSTVQK